MKNVAQYIDAHMNEFATYDSAHPRDSNQIDVIERDEARPSDASLLTEIKLFYGWEEVLRCADSLCILAKRVLDQDTTSVFSSCTA